MPGAGVYASASRCPSVCPRTYIYSPSTTRSIRDCNSNNIMMDASGMYPRGFHPRLQNRNPEFTGPAKHLTRTQHPPKYYFVDFGIARRYDPANGPPLELPIEGGDKSVPEFQASNGPCDPFPTNVYYLGNFIRREFLEVIFMLVNSHRCSRTCLCLLAQSSHSWHRRPTWV